MAYLYRHVRLDKNEPFYIGISNDNNYQRAYSKKDRNYHWNNIVKNTEYRVEIMLDDFTWDEICEKEKEFILIYGKRINGGHLCNIADGGNGGCLGEEVNNKRKKSLKGHILSEETKDKIRQKAIGRKASESTKNKMSEIRRKNNSGHWFDNVGHKNGRAYKVYQYSLDGIFIKEWECAKYAIDFYSMSKTSITNCLSGRQKSSKGFIWTKIKNT